MFGLVVWNMFYLSIIYGMSSFPLTNTYVSRWLLHHQPVFQSKQVENIMWSACFDDNFLGVCSDVWQFGDQDDVFTIYPLVNVYI